MKNLVSALVYFLIVFGAGFLLGVVRVSLLVPRLGERTAELLELPVMLIVIYLTAMFVVRRFKTFSVWDTMFTGFFALFLLLLAEFGLVLSIRGISIQDYLGSRDPFSFSAYLGALLVFAFAPLIIARFHPKPSG